MEALGGVEGVELETWVEVGKLFPEAVGPGFSRNLRVLTYDVARRHRTGKCFLNETCLA